jgi:GTP-binding protein LepA
MLDDMDLERERGITIKAHAVRLDYKANDGKQYVLNLIDTPGHVDFSYEVSRSLSACEGALLVVDASQGVEAQTLANTYLAIENNLELIPVLNKIDLPSAEPERIKEQIETIIGLDTTHTVLASAKTGVGVPEILEELIKDIPPPKGDASAPLKALIFDSWYDAYRGVIVLFRVIDGSVKKGMKIRFFNAGREYLVEMVGVNRPRPTPINELGPGEVGFLTASIKTVADVQIGDTITDSARPVSEPLPGFQEVKPMVFAGPVPDRLRTV